MAIVTSDHIPSLLKSLSRSNKHDGNAILNFLSSKGNIEASLTRKELDEKSSALAAHLLHDDEKLGLVKGDKCLLVFPPGLEFVLAFLACLKAGVVAVPVYPPHPGKIKDILMFAKVANDCQAKYALTVQSYRFDQKMISIQQSLSLSKKEHIKKLWPNDLAWVVVDSVLSQGGSSRKYDYSFEEAQPTDIAFLQYTSGSTSDPKGVMITHDNLAHNLNIIINELQANEDTVVVSWLPQYHDMGLIGSLLGIVYCGGTGYYMSPIAFLQRPMIWLECVSRYHATHLQAPNFAFKLTSRKFDSKKYRYCDSDDTGEEILDLSSIKHIINAAEPVDEESLNVFTETFGPFGLNCSVIFPTYGLAEHTVFVCSGGQQILSVNKEDLEMHDKVTIKPTNKYGENHDTRSIVGCGFPAKQQVDVRIVNPDSLVELEEDKVGEIWVNSPSKASGYYNMQARSVNEFSAKIEGDEMHIPYLRTGDLGFIHGGELFICGRLKDLIIVAGRNHFPQDLEATCEASSTELRPGCSGAFSIEKVGGSEQVILITEMRNIPGAKDKNEVCSSIVENIRIAVAKEHSLSLSGIVLLKPRTVPKTTSGKISRSKCRKAFTSKSLDVVYIKSYEPEMDFENENQNNAITSPTIQSVEIRDRSTIRNLDKREIQVDVKTSIGNLVSISPNNVAVDEPLNTILDSLNMSQLKGMIEHEYHVRELSDLYLFKDSVTVRVLVEIIKLGYAPDDNENGCSDNSAHVTNGNNSGLSGALGCPPGVCCTIM